MYTISINIIHTDADKQEGSKPETIGGGGRVFLSKDLCIIEWIFNLKTPSYRISKAVVWGKLVGVGRLVDLVSPKHLGSTEWVK